MMPRIHVDTGSSIPSLVVRNVISNQFTRALVECHVFITWSEQVSNIEMVKYCFVDVVPVTCSTTGLANLRQ